MHERLGIITQSWSPLGGITLYRPQAPNGGRSVLEEPVVVELAAKYVPKPVKTHRIAENCPDR